LFSFLHQKSTEAVNYIWKIFLKNSIFRIRELGAAGLVYFPNQISKWEPAAHLLLLAKIPAYGGCCTMAIFEIAYTRNTGYDLDVRFGCKVSSLVRSTVFRCCGPLS